MERSGQAIHVEAMMGQLATGGARRFRRRAAALIGWHEPDESRGSSPEFCEGLGTRFSDLLATGREFLAGDSNSLTFLFLFRVSPADVAIKNDLPQRRIAHAEARAHVFGK